jgi:cell division protein FtsN
MYCSTCELEIKGDDKDTCPVCGGPLTVSHQDDSSVSEQTQQEPAGADALFKDTERSAEPAPPPDSPGSDDVFVLKDYTSPDVLNEDSSGAPDEPALVEHPGPSDEPPLLKEPEQGSSADMDDILDSIRESIATPASPEAGPAAGGGDVGSLDVDFGSFDSFGQDDLADAPADNNADTSADISWGYDEASSAVPMTDTPQRKRSPALGIILLVVLIAVGGYYFFITRSGDQGSPGKAPAGVSAIVEPVFEENVEIAELTADTEPAVVADDESAVSVAPDSAGEKGAPRPSDQAGTEGLTVPAAAEPVASVGPGVAGGGQEDTASVGPESEAAVVPGAAETAASAEAVVADAGEAVKASAEALPEVPVAQEKAEAVVPVTPEPVKAPFFTVHVGSYQKRMSASSEVARLKAEGYDAFIERADLGKKGVWYRVKVGRFKNRAEAEKLQQKIEKVLVDDSMVVTQRTN